jgi:PAS domain S-box-containing protein
MQTILDDVVRAGFAVSGKLNLKRFTEALVEQLFDVTGADLVCFYAGEKDDRIRLLYKRGRYTVPDTLPADREPIPFMLDSRQTVVLTERKPSPFLPLLLDGSMMSGAAAPLVSGKGVEAFVILNSREPLFITRQRLRFIETLVSLAGLHFHNARLHSRLRDYTRELQAMEKYQESIFTSMSNLLVTIDNEGALRYFNAAAARTFSLSTESLGSCVLDLFRGRISDKMLDLIRGAVTDSAEIVGAEGIFRNNGTEIDFSLTSSPINGRGKKTEGLVLLFTDQSRERELERAWKTAKRDVRTIKEERRLIKDMFSRYLSQEVVSRLISDPDAVHLGGDKRTATVMFADIRGYTSFSEGKDPEYIIKVLNEYFSEAVELIVQHQGFIDKYIGDCIMAAWGVPLQSEQEDARMAVACAMQIQDLIQREDRTFFTGEAAGLSVGMGIHTGPLVAGNIGSSRRVDYTVIGDTVNIASRMEGISGPGEVIVTEDTRELIADFFKLRKKKPVKVKGKSDPVNIYKVVERVE